MVDQSIENSEPHQRTWKDANWPDDYRAVCYTTWYRNSKPTAKILVDLIPVEEHSGRKPGIKILEDWIKTTFAESAIVTDETAMEMLHKDNALAKVEMLERHALLGRKMQDLAVKYFDEHGVETLKARDAINILVQGIKVERESRFPQEKEFSKLAEMNDEQLLAELEKEAKSTILDVESDDASSYNSDPD